MAVRKARVPQIPDVVLALRDELARPEPDIAAAAELIAQDLALTGQVLKTINSPLFACRTKIGSVKQAVTMMGIKRLANLVTAEAIQRMLQATQGPARMVWEAIMEQANVTVAITRHIGGISSDEAYLFGIMQDVGSLIFADQLDSYGAEWAFRSAADAHALIDYEKTAMGVDHTTVGFLLAGIWRLPEQMALAIYHHHDDVGSCELEDGKSCSMIAMSKLARYLIALPLGTHETAEMLSNQASARQSLNISEDDWAVLCEDAVAGVWSR